MSQHAARLLRALHAWLSDFALDVKLNILKQAAVIASAHPSVFGSTTTEDEDEDEDEFHYPQEKLSPLLLLYLSRSFSFFSFSLSCCRAKLYRTDLIQSPLRHTTQTTSIPYSATRRDTIGQL